MAQYKVPQDVEADDKLLGPFTFRQFIYLIVAVGTIALAWALFQVFPLLVIIPIPIILFFGALALPLKKDQPMETYFAAIVSFYLKPRKRFWEPGQAESTIQITAPKKAEPSRVKDISQDEASHRLSFLAEIVDSEGQAIKGANLSPIKAEVVAEAANTADMFEISNFTTNNITQIMQDDSAARHQAVIEQMKNAIRNANELNSAGATIQKFNESDPLASNIIKHETVIMPDRPNAIPPTSTNQPKESAIPSTKPTEPQNQPASTPPPKPSPAFVNLANDQDLSIETIAKEANRLKKKQDDEIFISLH